MAIYSGFPINSMVIFHSYASHYQRVNTMMVQIHASVGQFTRSKEVLPPCDPDLVQCWYASSADVLVLLAENAGGQHRWHL
jgi:hypothetical protein